MSERCKEIREILLEFKGLDLNDHEEIRRKVESKFYDLIDECVAKKEKEGIHKFKAEESCYEEINPIDTKGIRKAIYHAPKVWGEIESRVLDPLIKNMIAVLEECKCE